MSLEARTLFTFGAWALVLALLVPRPRSRHYDGTKSSTSSDPATSSVRCVCILNMTNFSRCSNAEINVNLNVQDGDVMPQETHICEPRTRFAGTHTHAANRAYAFLVYFYAFLRHSIIVPWHSIFIYNLNQQNKYKIPELYTLWMCVIQELLLGFLWCVI